VRPGEAGANQAVHLRAVRVILGEEALLEKQELPAVPDSMRKLRRFMGVRG
jgi:hypothetical protein